MVNSTAFGKVPNQTNYFLPLTYTEVAPKEFGEFRFTFKMELGPGLD